MRTFIAINFTQDIKNRLISVERDLKQMSQKGRFTSKDSHFSLFFIPEVNYVGDQELGRIGGSGD